MERDNYNEDIEALKIHGYQFTPSDGESDDTKSELDAEYYNVQPPVRHILPSQIIPITSAGNKEMQQTSAHMKYRQTADNTNSKPLPGIKSNQSEHFAFSDNYRRPTFEKPTSQLTVPHISTTQRLPYTSSIDAHKHVFSVPQNTSKSFDNLQSETKPKQTINPKIFSNNESVKENVPASTSLKSNQREHSAFSDNYRRPTCEKPSSSQLTVSHINTTTQPLSYRSSVDAHVFNASQNKGVSKNFDHLQTEIKPKQTINPNIFSNNKSVKENVPAPTILKSTSARNQQNYGSNQLHNQRISDSMEDNVSNSDLREVEEELCCSWFLRCFA